MQFRLQRRSTPNVNITPFIDVVFLLLIFFMLSTTFVVQPGISVNLPKAESQADSRTDEATVVVTAEGVLYLDEQRVSMDELGAGLTKRLQEAPETVVIIKADQAINHGLVVTVMDLAKRHGVRRIAIATQPRDRAP